jgi:glutaredoxin-like protein NrdH
MMAVNHVSGNKKGDVMLYALSTCVWCKKTKNLLEELNVDFYFTDVDLLDSGEKEKTKEEIKKWNPSCSFPSLVIDNKFCIVGYDEKKVRETFK